MFTGDADGAASSVEPTIRSDDLYAPRLLWSALTPNGMALTLATVCV